MATRLEKVSGVRFQVSETAGREIEEFRE
jgi:hypothetical protein